MKRKYKQWWSIIPPISTKRKITSHLHSLNTKKTTTYDVGNPGPGLGQAHKCGSVKLVNVIPTIPLFFLIFNLLTKWCFYFKSETFPLTVIWGSLRITNQSWSIVIIFLCPKGWLFNTNLTVCRSKFVTFDFEFTVDLDMVISLNKLCQWVLWKFEWGRIFRRKYFNFLLLVKFQNHLAFLGRSICL